MHHESSYQTFNSKSLNAKLLLGVWPTFGIIVASIFFALLLADLIVTKILDNNHIRPLTQ